MGSGTNVKVPDVLTRQKLCCVILYRLIRHCIFLSPVFTTKKSNKFLGICKFNNLVKLTSKKIVCLGGIKKNNLKKIKLLNTYGFSSVSLFKQNIKYISF